MPTVFTHALVGSAIAALGPREARGPRLAVALAAVSVAPDLDVVSFALGIPYQEPLGHRGLSHSLAFAVLLGACVPLALARGGNATSRGWLWALGFLAAASHGVLDAFTRGGLGIGFFLPFYDDRYFFSLRPILVSPIGPSFFGPRGLAVLANELRWIWLPVLAGVAAIALLRRLGTRRVRGILGRHP